MFSNILHKSIQVGEKVFHILCDINTTVEELEKFGVEIIKIASDIKEKNKSEEEVKTEEPPKEA